MMYYHIVNKQGKIIASNLTEDRLLIVNQCKSEAIRIYCPIAKKPMRHGKVTRSKGDIYLATYDENITDTSFRRYMEVYYNLLDEFEKIQQQVNQQEVKHFRRLKHNLVNYNTHILQGIYRFVSQDSLTKGGKSQIALIENLIKDNPKATAELILKILKNANLEKAEYDVYDMIYKTSPVLEFSNHSIHRVIYLTLNSFWLDFLEKNIDIYIEDCNEELCFDYKSISVVLGHIFDNAIKYSSPNSNFRIIFQKSYSKFEVIFDMISIKIEPDELENIFSEGISGYWASKLELNGGGYGLFIIKSLAKLNNVSFLIKPNVDRMRVFHGGGVTYENNQFILEFNSH